MKLTSFIALAMSALVSAAPAFAQQATPTAAPASSASMDCGKSTMKRHDHGAERNTGATAGTMAMPCPAADAASAPEKTTKKKPAHDHAKFHKNQ